MSYYLAKVLSLHFDEGVTLVVDALKADDFSILTEIDVSSTLKNKIGVDYPAYKILGPLGSAHHKNLVDMIVTKREAAGLTQAQLAEKLGECQSFVARLESGQRRIDVIEFLGSASILGFDPAKAIRSIQRKS